MTFLAINAEDLSCDDHSSGYRIYFAPLPEGEEYPTAWLDLHIGGDYYQDCEEGQIKKTFRGPDATGRRYVKIRRGEGVRLYTAESIGLDRNHSAVVTNTTRRAKHGLIVAPGKIDPGFNPRPLVLVAFNQSKRIITLYVGDKIASIAFVSVTERCHATTSSGHVDGSLSDFDLPWGDRMRSRIRSFLYRDYGNLPVALVSAFAAAVFVLLVPYLVSYIGSHLP